MISIFISDDVKKFLVVLFLLLTALSACAQKSVSEGVLEEDGTLCGKLVAIRREGFYVRTENNDTYCFELAEGVDLSDFDMGDELNVRYKIISCPVAISVWKAED